MSSSSSSQRRAYPLSTTSTAANCCSVALERMRNRSAGKPTVRPSCNSRNTMRPCVQTRTAAGSTASFLSSIVEFIVCFQQLDVVFEHQLLNTPQISGPDSLIACETDDRLQPKLALAIVCPDMDVRRFHSLIGIEVEPVRPDSQDRGHWTSVWTWAGAASSFLAQLLDLRSTHRPFPFLGLDALRCADSSIGSRLRDALRRRPVKSALQYQRPTRASRICWWWDLSRCGKYWHAKRANFCGHTRLCPLHGRDGRSATIPTQNFGMRRRPTAPPRAR